VCFRLRDLDPFDRAAPIAALSFVFRRETAFAFGHDRRNERGVSFMPTITKKDLIDRIAEDTNQKRTVIKETIQSLLKHMIIELGEGNRLEFRDFGVFEIKERAPRVAQNPKTLERVDVPAKKTVKFKVGRLMKEAVDNPDTVIPLLREESEPEPQVIVRSNGRHPAARK